MGQGCFTCIFGFDSGERREEKKVVPSGLKEKGEATIALLPSGFQNPGCSLVDLHY